MAKYIPDISSMRWVILSPQRLGRPGVDGKTRVCPFCAGHEAETTEEVLRYGPGEAGTPGWQLRVVKNKYPITDIHEVIIHSPNHDKDLEDMTLNQVELVLRAYRERYNQHKDQGQVMIFCNHGEHAGASIDHPHSQLVVLPTQINIDALSKEPIQNVVTENNYFKIYCPDFSQWPYEVWLAPKKEGTVFGEITDEEIADMAEIMQHILKKMEHIYRVDKVSSLPFGYNFYIYPKENWYLRIIPRFIHRAGFELGTGLSVNVVDPADAAEKLR